MSTTKNQFELIQEKKDEILNYIDQQGMKPIEILADIGSGKTVKLVFFLKSQEFAVSIGNVIQYVSMVYERAMEKYIELGGKL